ncbi:MAG: hypothetical protein R3D98_00370 [Candidatus Krumholzibacteriia bacterium]
MRNIVLQMLLVVLATPVVALPVNHESPDGVAALDVQRVFGQHGFNPREFTVFYALTTEGVIHVQIWEDLDEKGGDWREARPEWPVPFAEIVDWIPSPMYPAMDEPALAAGIVTTVDGVVWRALPRFGKSWDAGPSLDGIRWEQVKVRR